MKSLVFNNFAILEYTRKEQFLSLATNLEFCGDDIKMVSITSARENEGKSYISMQLMRTMAQMGKKVLLLDTDLRKSRIAVEYRAKSEDEVIGLSHYLAGKAELDEIIFETNIENAHIIFSGKLVSNPVNLFKKDRFDNMLQELRNSYDFIIMDTPPIQPVIDGAFLATKCDGTLIVINYGLSSIYEINETKKQLLSAHANILGTVLNNVPTNAGKYYYKSSKYYNKYKYYRYYGRYAPYERPYGVTVPSGSTGVSYNKYQYKADIDD